MTDVRPDTLARILALISQSTPALAHVAVEEHSDLYDLGLDSTAAVALMLSIEEAFGITFPDSLLDEATFRTPASLTAAVNSLYR